MSVAVCAACAGIARAQPQAAPEVTKLRIATSLGAATLVSKDQVGRLGFEGFGPLVDADVGYALKPWLDAEVGVVGAAFPKAQGTGGLLAPVVSLRLNLPDPLLRPYLQADVGPGFSGALVRPFMRVSFGIELQASAAFAIGPKLGYGRLFQTNRKGDSTDATLLWLGVSVSYWPGGREIVHEVVRIESERVVQVHDVVPPSAGPPVDLDALLDNAVPAARVELLAPVLFKLDSDELEPIGVAMLHEVASELRTRKDILLLEVQGYTDQRGSAEHNQALSQRRAARVVEWLVLHEIEPERLRVAAEGASQPVEIGTSEQAHEQNRRVVFRVKRMQGDADAAPVPSE